MLKININQLKCKLCKEIFNSPVLCKNCYNPFCYDCALSYKKREEKKHIIINCPICGNAPFKFQRSFEAEIILSNMKKNCKRCNHCHKIFFDNYSFDIHIKSCKFFCRFCYHEFDNECEFINHFLKNKEEISMAVQLMNVNNILINLKNSLLLSETIKKNKSGALKRPQYYTTNTEDVILEENEEQENDYRDYKNYQDIHTIKKNMKKSTSFRNKITLDENKNNNKINNKVNNYVLGSEYLNSKKKTISKKKIINNNLNSSQKMHKKNINKKQNHIEENEYNEKEDPKFNEFLLNNNKIINNRYNKEEEDFEEEDQKEINNKKCYINKKSYNYIESNKKIINKIYPKNIININVDDENSSKKYIQKEKNNIDNENDSNEIEKQIITLPRNKTNIVRSKKKKKNNINPITIMKNSNSNSGLTAKNNIWGSTQSKKHITLNDNDVEIINLKKNCKSKISLGEKYVQNVKLKSSLGSMPNIMSKSLRESVEFIQDEKKPNPYINLLGSNEIFSLPNPNEFEDGNICWDEEMNLFYCYRNNNITNKLCKKGNLMCLDCLKTNQKYYGLKKHYLINSAGRACKYNYGACHCYCNFNRKFTDSNDNVFFSKYKCQGKNTCLSCQEITKYIEFYVPKQLLQKLKERDLKESYVQIQ